MDGAKVKDYPGLVRPTGSGGIVNVNRDEYERAQARAKKSKRDKNLELRVESLESKLDKILDLLTRA